MRARRRQRSNGKFGLRSVLVMLFCGLCFCGLAIAEGAHAAGESAGHRGGAGQPDADRRADRHSGRHADRRGGRLSLAAKYAGELGLEPEAQAAIEQIVETSGVRDETLRERLDRARGEMKALMRGAHHPDRAAVMAQADVIAQAEAEIHKNRLDAILQIRDRLSPEQRKELMRLAEERRGPSAAHGHRDRRHKDCAGCDRRDCAGRDAAGAEEPSEP